MTWNMHDKEYDSVLSLPGERRYAYFIKRLAGEELLWSLAGEAGWVLAGDNEGREVVPVWPHARFAAACATGEWADTEPRSIELTNWLEKWIPGMLRDRRFVAVFPTPSDKGVVITPTRLREDLAEELSLYG